jgi:NADH-quinone oxidoreductase subunit F
MPRLVSHPDEVKIVTKRFGMGATDIDKYIELGGYEALKKCIAQGPEWIVNEMKASNLRGRGGAGFPTGLKWSFVPKQSAKPKYVLINGDESEPGTCKDHLIFLHDPHAVIEGTIIAGLAIGSKLGFIYLRGEYRYLLEIMEKAVADAYAKGIPRQEHLRVGLRVPGHYADGRGRVRGGGRVGADGVARRQARSAAHQASLPCCGWLVRRADGDQ